MFPTTLVFINSLALCLPQNTHFEHRIFIFQLVTTAKKKGIQPVIVQKNLLKSAIAVEVRDIGPGIVVRMSILMVKLALELNQLQSKNATYATVLIIFKQIVRVLHATGNFEYIASKNFSSNLLTGLKHLQLIIGRCISNKNSSKLYFHPYKQSHIQIPTPKSAKPISYLYYNKQIK